MNKDYSTPPRPTFKRTLRRISVTSVFITMTLIWLLLCGASIVTLKQYAQKNLELTGSTMSHSLEAALVFNDNTAATETLAMLGKQGHFATAEVVSTGNKRFAYWHYNASGERDTLNRLVSQWLFPLPVTQPITYNGQTIGELRLTARDSLISHFIWLSLGVLTACIVFASAVALLITRHLHEGVVTALQSITDVVHDVRTNRNFSRRVSAERIDEFHRFALDFNSLLDEMEEWQLKLQAKNAQLLRTALHDALTGLPNRAAFRTRIAALMSNPQMKASSALLFLDGDNFKRINDTWGHAAGDCVLIDAAKRLMEFSGNRHAAYRLGGDEFAVILSGVNSEHEVQRICAALSQQFIRPFDLRNGHYVPLSLSVGYALTWEHNSVEDLQELADKNMYDMKNQRSKNSL